MQQQIACTVCKQNSVLVILILLIVLSSQQPFQDVDKVSSFLLTTTVDNRKRCKHTKFAQQCSGSDFNGISVYGSFLRAYSISTAN